MGRLFGYTVQGGVLVADWDLTGGGVPVPPPSPPAGLAAVAGDRRVSLSWVSVPSAVSYWVYRDGAPAQLVTGGLTSAVDAGLTAGRAYSYQVTAVGAAGGESPKTAAVTATPTGPVDPAPPVPTGLAATGGDGTVTLAWGANPTGTASFRLYRVDPAGPVRIYDALTPRSFTDTGRVNGVTYTYRVSAVDAIGQESALSDPVFGVPVAQVVVVDPEPAADSYWVAAAPVTRGRQIGASNAGIPPGTTLTAASSNTVAVPNTVGKTFSGNVSMVPPAGETYFLRRCKISGGYVRNDGAGRIVVMDCEIDGQNVAGMAVGSTGITVRRCHVHGTLEGFRMNSRTTEVIETYLHDMFRTAGAHIDAAQSTTQASTPHRLIRCHFEVYKPSTNDPMNAAYIVGGTLAEDNIELVGNLFNGGNYTLSFTDTCTNVKITDNEFGRAFRFGPYLGPGSPWNKATWTWARNTWFDSGTTFRIEGRTPYSVVAGQPILTGSP